ncbi:MAG: phosphodiester glycosidase family protein, partial [Bacteroidota bacterium]
ERPPVITDQVIPGNYVVGAVNGDFYGTIPIGIQILDGEILRTPIDKSTLGFDVNKSPMINIVNFSGVVKRSAVTATLDGINQTRATNQLILYNKYFGASTGTNVFGAEALIRPVGAWLVNDTLTCVVDTVVNSVGSMPIPTGKAVLSGHGVAQTFVNTNLHSGDTVKVYQGIAPALSRLKEMIGGFPKIVSNGVDYVDQGYSEESGPSHTYERHPRTAAGFSADSTKLYLVTVDGRQASSVGMTLHELATFMLRIGVHTGINFDGGGSTTMVVRGAVVNSPSDGGGERSVSNALLAISSAPIDTLSRILLNPKKYRIYRGDSFVYTVTRIDRYGNPIPLAPSLIRFQVSPNLGSIDSTGRFTAAMTPDSGNVYVRYNQFSDSAFVIIKSINRILLTPENVVTDTFRTVAFNARAFDPDGTERSITLSQYNWQSTDARVGTVDSSGVFKGKSSGMTLVIAKYLSLADTSQVRVEIGSGMRILDSLETLQGWTLSGINIDSAATSLSLQNGIATLGGRSLKISYSFMYNPNRLNYVRLDTDIPIFGVPDSIYLDVRADSAGHRVIYHVDDDNGEQFKVFSSRFIIPSAKFDTIRTALKNFIPASGGGSFNYPIRLRRIEIQLGSGRVAGNNYKGTICVDNLRISYPAQITSVSSSQEIPGAFILYQNYPNPFNPSTRIRFEVAGSGYVSLKVYDVLGREITTLVNEIKQRGTYEVEWDARGLASGVYFY